MNQGVSRELAKYWWLRCVACSEASFTTQMRGFGFEEPAYEQAIHAFSGGFMHQGHVSGLLTGAVFAAGFVAQERFQDHEKRAEATLHVAEQLAKAYPEDSGSINCREITESNLTSWPGRLIYVKEGKGRMCGRLHLKWAPKAHQIIDKSLIEYGENEPIEPRVNCSVKAMHELELKFGMKEGISTLVAGFAGGVGLCGNLCGALAVGAYTISLIQQFDRKKKKRDSRIRGSIEEVFGTNYKGNLTQFRLDFVRKFGSELCSDIVGRHFKDSRDHSEFLKKGGCNNLINFVNDWVIKCSTNNRVDP